MSEAQSEKIFVSNAFGQVTDRRVVCHRKKGWFSGGSREDVALRDVASVRVDTARSIIGAVLLILLGLGLPLGYGIGIILLAFGVLLIWGSPSVVVNTAAADLEAMKGWPWERRLAEEFAQALRSQLVKS